MTEERLAFLRSRIRDIQDFPKEGILFKDITPLLADVEAFRICIQLMVERLNSERVTAVLGIESRGFMFGAAQAPCGDLSRRVRPRIRKRRGRDPPGCAGAWGSGGRRR